MSVLIDAAGKPPLDKKTNGCDSIPLPQGLTIEKSDAFADKDWDRFVEQLPGAHHEQTSIWAQFRRHCGWQPVRWVASLHGRIVGGVQVLVRPLARLGHVGYVVHGPLCEEGRADVEEMLVDKATAHAHKHRFIYQVFDFPYCTRTLEGTLDRRGYTPHPLSIPPTSLITATLIMDVRPTHDEILKNMNASVRRNIRYGEKAGFEMIPGSEEHLDTFWHLMVAICNRRGTDPSPSNPDFFKKLWKVLAPHGYVRLFLVRLGEEVVAAAFAFTVGDTARVWKVGWSGAHQRKYPNHFMWWSIARWVKANGFKQLDFVWVDDHDAKLLAQGEKRPAAFREGTTFFKMGFGGRLVTAPAARSRFFHPALRIFVRGGGMRLLESRASRFLLGGLWDRLAGQA